MAAPLIAIHAAGLAIAWTGVSPVALAVAAFAVALAAAPRRFALRGLDLPGRFPYSPNARRSAEA